MRRSCSGMYGLSQMQTFWTSERTNEESFSKWMVASPLYTFLMQVVGEVSNTMITTSLADENDGHEACAAQ
ncbi:hypothetical protein VNO77_06767 [Canavalia gladiata]|uniref:Uncharacterized protein n=1 Tax=Canavalia gladiata TaxID=3824 RepID=A0AAN9QW98_CANGL